MHAKRSLQKKILFQLLNIIALSFSMLIMVFLLGGLYLILYNLFGIFETLKKGDICVKLPNGAFIARQSIITNHPSYWFNYEVSLKHEDGTIISGFSDWQVHITQSTIYSYETAYRPDIGLIKRADNPEIYQKIIDKAGALIQIPPIGENEKPPAKNVNGQINLRYAYDALRFTPPYKYEYCSIRLLP